jgi:hypothetical protein
MALVKDGPAPYTTTPALMEVIDAFRHRSPRTPVTVEGLQMLNIPETIAPRTLQALKLLDLLDEGGEPTDALLGLKEASQEDFPARLADVIRAAYAELFAYGDPTNDPPERVVDLFRRYSPASMRPRMVRLFYGLCKEAGMISAIPAVSNKPGGIGGASGTVTRARTLRAATGTVTTIPRRNASRTDRAPSVKAEPPTPEPPPRSPGTSLPQAIHPALVGLLKLIPAEGESWKSRERYDTFKAAWDATLAATNPIASGEGEDK